MAYELKAVLKLQDKMTAPLLRIKNAVGDADDASDKASKAFKEFADSMKKASTVTKSVDSAANKGKAAVKALGDETKKTETKIRSFTAQNAKFGNSFGTVQSGIGGLRSGFLGLASAIGGAYAAKKAFDLTIGAAAHREMNVVTMEAMFNDTAKAGKFFDFIEKRAAESMFSESDFFSSTRGFVTVTKDQETLEKMVGLQERLAAYDPLQGLEGASFALRELFSGDGVSMVERFELPRSVINEIKKMDLPDQLAALDRVLSEMGITQELLDKQDATALAQYTQGVDKLRLGLMKMGQQGLEKIKPMLVQFNEMLDGPGFDRFIAFGSDIMGGLMQGVVDGVTQARRYVETNFINNPAFNNLPDTKSKVLFVIDDLLKTFNVWLKGDGGAQVEATANLMSEVIGKALTAATKPIAEAASNIGKAIAQGIWDGLMQAAKDNPVMSALLAGGGAFLATPGPLPVKVAAALGVGGTALINGGTAKLDENRRLAQEAKIDALANPKGLSGPTAIENVEKANWFMQQYYRMTGGKHATGLSRVPRDNYPALLHKDETVLTKGEADKRRMGRGDSGGVLVTGNTFHVRHESDIDAIARALAREISGVGGAAFNG
jgi:hypothetical protein